MCLDRPEFKLKLDLLKETYNHNTLMYIYNIFFSSIFTSTRQQPPGLRKNDSAEMQFL